MIELFHGWIIENRINKTAQRQAQYCKLLIKNKYFELLIRLSLVMITTIAILSLSKDEQIVNWSTIELILENFHNTSGSLSKAGVK